MPAVISGVKLEELGYFLHPALESGVICARNRHKAQHIPNPLHPTGEQVSVRPRYAFPGIIFAAAIAASTFVATPAFAADVPITAKAASPSTALPSSYPYQEDLQVFPDNPLDASIARGALPYDEIAPKLNDWTGETDIISTQVVGKSANQWDLYLVTITAPETATETAQQEAWKDEIKYNSAVAADDEELAENYKRPIWFNGNIHGNEWEGTDASMNYIEYLLQNENTSYVQNLLQNYRLYFTVSNNPDGRIIGQRPNGQNFDLNRDFVTNTTPETTLIKDLTAEIQPIFFIDLHGYTGVLQVEPCGPPHGENYDYDLFIPHAYAAALAIEEDVVAAGIAGNTYQDKVTKQVSTTRTDTSGIIIPYRDTPSGWDDWPPVFTAQYVAYQGAISYTVELPLGRVTGSTAATQNPINSAIDTKVAFTVIGSTLDYIDENNDAILQNQIEIFRRGEAGEPLKKINTPVDTANFTGPTQWAAIWGTDDAQGHDDATGVTFPRAYVIPKGAGQKSDSDAATLVGFLMTHGVKVKKSSAEFTSGGTTYPAGSYIVDMHQPLRGLANALLASGSDISGWVPSMYDISAWSQGYLWGATVDRVGDTLDADLPVAAAEIAKADATGTVPTGLGYLNFSLDGVDDFRGLNYLLGQNIPVSLVGTNTAVVGNDAATHAAAETAAATYGVAFTATPGTELAGTNVKPLKKLSLGYTGTQDDLYSLRQLGFGADQLTLISTAAVQAGTIDLNTFDVLWLGAAFAPNASTQPLATSNLASYVASGKGIVGRGAGALAAANANYDLGATAVTGNSSGNGIVNLTIPTGSTLGGLGTKYGFIYPAISYALSGTSHGKIEQTYAMTNTLISGHWRQTTATNGPLYAAGRASVVSSTLDSGAKSMVFGTSVVFRTHTKGHFSEVATGLYWAAKPSTGAKVAVPVATTTTLELSKATAVFGSTGASAVVKVTSATPVDSVSGSVEILSGSTVIATTSVNKFGNGKVTLPSDLAVGDYPLVAKYTPAAGAALSTSGSSPVDYTVTASTATELTLSTATQYFGIDPTATAEVVVSLVDGVTDIDGTVSLLVDGEEIDSTDVADGTVAFVLPSDIEIGAHEITASFTPAEGAPLVGSVSSASTLTVEAAPPVEPEKVTPTVAVTTEGARYGTPASATITVDRDEVPAVGSVGVEIDGQSFGVVELVEGAATVALPSNLAAGNHSVTATFLGNETTTTAVDEASVTIKKALTKLSRTVTSSQKAVLKQTRVKVTFTLSTSGVSVPLSGTVRALDGSKTIKTFTLKTSSNGTMSVALPVFTKKGTHKVKFEFAGTSNLSKSESPVFTVTVK